MSGGGRRGASSAAASARGIHESTDGGKTWKRVVSTPTNGLPHGTMGRIAFDWSRSNPKMLYAQIEVAPDKEPRNLEAEAAAAAARGAGGGGRGAAAAGAGAAGAAGAAGGGAARAGAAGGGGGQGGGRGGQAAAPNPQSSGIWRSADSGKTWEFRSNQNQRPMYFSQIRVDPNNPDIVYVGGVNAQKSTDGAKTFDWPERHGPRGQPRDLDRSAEQPARDVRQRRRLGRLVGRRRDVGSAAAPGRGPALLRVGGHAASLLGLHGPPGQRVMVRAEFDA